MKALICALGVVQLCSLLAGCGSIASTPASRGEGSEHVSKAKAASSDESKSLSLLRVTNPTLSIAEGLVASRVNSINSEYLEAGSACRVIGIVFSDYDTTFQVCRVRIDANDGSRECELDVEEQRLSLDISQQQCVDLAANLTLRYRQAGIGISNSNE